MHGSCVFYILISNNITDFLREIIVIFAKFLWNKTLRNHGFSTGICQVCLGTIFKTK